MAYVINGLILYCIALFAYRTVGKKHPEVLSKNSIQVLLLCISIPMAICGLVLFLFASGYLGGNSFQQGYCGF